MEKYEEQIMLYSVGVAFLLFFFIDIVVDNISVNVYIKAIVYITGCAIAGRYIYPENISLFVVAMGILGVILSLVASLPVISEPEETAQAIAESIFPLFIASSFVVYGIKVKEILSLEDREVVLEKKKQSFWIAHIIIFMMVIYMMLSEIGIATYIHVPAILSLLVPLVVTYYYIKSVYKKLLLIKHYLLSVPMYIYVTMAMAVLFDTQPDVVGPAYAIVILSTAYSIYLYFVVLKPLLIEAEIIENNMEIYFLFYSLFMLLSLIMGFWLYIK